MYILSASTCAKFGVSSWCYYLIIIVILSFSQVTVHYIYILQEVLIAWEEQSEELGKKIKYEEKLLKEAECWKLVLQRQILEEWLDSLKRDNMLKEEKLLDMRKHKEHTLGEVCELGRNYMQL